MNVEAQGSTYVNEVQKAEVAFQTLVQCIIVLVELLDQEVAFTRVSIESVVE